MRTVWRFDEVADLLLGDAGDPRDRGRDARPRQVEAGLGDRRLERADRRPRAALRRPRVVELLLADGVLGRERLGARDVEVRLRERGPGLLEVRLRLLELRLELARVDLEEELAPARRCSLPCRRAAGDIPPRAGGCPRSRRPPSCRSTRGRSARRAGSRPRRTTFAGAGGAGAFAREQAKAARGRARTRRCLVMRSLFRSLVRRSPAPSGGTVRTGQWAPRTIGCVVAPRTWRWTPTTRRSADSSSAMRTRASRRRARNHACRDAARNASREATARSTLRRASSRRTGP